jgi:transcriptional regulator with XRE-family HTH domain
VDPGIVPLEHPGDGWLVAAGTPGNQRFGSLLKAMRIRSGLTPEQLANQAEVHVSFVRGIERGAQAPSLATARALLACMDEHELLEWLSDGPPDLRMLDPQGDATGFQFKAEVQGQNRRKAPLDLTGIKAGLLLFAERSSQLVDGLRDGQTEDAASVPRDERLGRIVRMLPSADAQTLGVIERLLQAAQADQDSV